MPIEKYLTLRKAAEIEEIRLRLAIISDNSAAFSGNKEHMNKLMKSYNEIMGFSQIIDAPRDVDSTERLKKWKR